MEQNVSSSSSFDIGRLLGRLKSIFLSPKAVWDEIWQEELTVKELLLNYYIPLAALSSACSFLGMVIFGIDLPIIGSISVSFMPALIHAIVQVALCAVYIVLGGMIVSWLSSKFGGEVSDVQASKLLAFSSFPAMASGILGLIPLLSMLSIFFALYSLFVMYQGFSALSSVPDGRRLGLFVVSLIVLLLTFAVLGGITSMILPSYYSAPEVGRSIQQGIADSLGNIKDEDAKKFLDTMQKLGQDAANRQ